MNKNCKQVANEFFKAKRNRSNSFWHEYSQLTNDSEQICATYKLALPCYQSVRLYHAFQVYICARTKWHARMCACTCTCTHTHKPKCFPLSVPAWLDSPTPFPPDHSLLKPHFFSAGDIISNKQVQLFWNIHLHTLTYWLPLLTLSSLQLTLLCTHTRLQTPPNTHTDPHTLANRHARTHTHTHTHIHTYIHTHACTRINTVILNLTAAGRRGTETIATFIIQCYLLFLSL